MLTNEEALQKAKQELSTSRYMSECSFNNGLQKIHSNRVEWLSLVVSMAEDSLYNTVKWTDSSIIMPENMSENAGKKVIPCLVCIKSRYPNGKPNIEKRMRQLRWDGKTWEWSKLRGSNVTHWAPLPYPNGGIQNGST